MTVMIGNARISEHGTVNGSKGDQTGREVMEQPWSTGGTWTYVIRPKSKTAALEIAKAMKQACANPNIGYSQADRLSLFNLASRNGFRISKVGKCNTDCSALVAVCVNAAGIQVPATMYTGNELDVLRGTGRFRIFTASAYTKASGKLRTGDILLRQGHTAVVTEGAVALKTDAPKRHVSKYAKVAAEVISGRCSDPRWKTWGNGLIRKRRLKKAGYTKEEITKIQAEINKLLR